ncbi:receptor-transporting protein 3 [Theropithecus gelada]|uniref:Receptor transporter protein 3 n=1 Tax=Theropithecus gelada TaxID=9565 RepID=A0A8D2F2Y6_THEGE|nr:receptor-transporting protein 3 [Theropithecus gelada]
MTRDTEVWKQMFQELMREVKPWHRWTLRPDKGLLPNVLKPGWMQYQQWTFARFQCSSCSRNWASAQVLVLFHMHWSEEKSRGQVKMRVFTQRCKKCPQPLFEDPEFTQENISRILKNLVFRIMKKCYRGRFQLTEEVPMIKDISLEGPHNSDNCEACLEGFCARSKQVTSLPQSQTPRVYSIYKVEEGVEPWASRKNVCSDILQNHICRNVSIFCCCVILIVIVVIVARTAI